MKKLSTISRYLLGFLFLLSGVIGLFNLVPPPADLPAAMMDFMKGMEAAKYFLPLLKLTELICGLLLLVGVAPALMLMILAPVTINILGVHAFLTPGFGNLVVPLILLALHVLSSVNYWDVYKPLLKRPTSEDAGRR